MHEGHEDSKIAKVSGVANDRARALPAAGLRPAKRGPARASTALYAFGKGSRVVVSS